MSGKDEYMRTPENLTGWQSFKRFLYNSDTGEVCGRTGCSWLKITVFYIIFYACLAAFWAAMLVVFYQTLSFTEPKWKLDGSRIGTNPGLGFRPRPPESNVDSTLIWVKSGSSSKDWQYWVDNLDKFLDPYRKIGTQKGERFVQCDYEQGPGKDGVCIFTLDNIQSPCTVERNFGYDIGQPCVLIKLNRIYGWNPDPYTNDTLPSNMPDEVKRKQMQHPQDVYISCEGENPADVENMGPITYTPSSQALPRYYFPFENTPGYLSPFVFVHFRNPTTGVLVNVECKAWAANIEHDRMERMGSVHFELLVD